MTEEYSVEDRYEQTEVKGQTDRNGLRQIGRETEKKIPKIQEPANNRNINGSMLFQPDAWIRFMSFCA